MEALNACGYVAGQIESSCTSICSNEIIRDINTKRTSAPKGGGDVR